MMDFKRAFKEGSKRADLKTYQQVLVRGTFYEVVIAFGMWGRFNVWVRLLVGLTGLFVYALIAALTRLGKWMERVNHDGKQDHPEVKGIAAHAWVAPE